jgi:hypothetical protein
MSKSNPRVLYTGDNEGPSVMTLQTLIDSFNLSGGWQYRHNEDDMRDELDSRGWYSGLHDNGHYLAINIDKLGMEPSPALLAKPGGVHPDLGGYRSPPAPVVSDEALKASSARFWTWFDGVNANAKESPAGAFMAAQGYTIAHTGGGCLAWEKKLSADSQWSVWIVDGDAGLGIEEHGDAFQTATDFGCMLTHDESGEFVNGLQETTIGACMAWAERALANPGGIQNEMVLNELAENDGAILHWQVTDRERFAAALKSGAIKMEADCYVHPLATRVSDSAWEMPGPCKHRDNGRGICCDCGTVL